jgi:uncharacterized membrane protein YfcA
MEIIGYILALLVGVSLGLIGSGGSILTVPILVYLMAVDTVSATAYSLFIVGVTALIGGIQNYMIGRVDLKTAIIFGIPSIISVYLTRYFLVPYIPDEAFTLGGFIVTKSILLMSLFAIVMIAASISMIRSRSTSDESSEIQYNYPMILLEGAVVGVLTGLVGAGGGFLIIPALVVFAKIPMKKAIGTSLLIIAAKSLIGFTGDLSRHANIDWSLLLFFTLSAVIGIILGILLSKKVAGSSLKKAFGYFVLVMGIFILVTELMGH